MHWVKDTHNFIENFRRAGIAYLSKAAQLVLGILFVSVLLLVASGHQVRECGWRRVPGVLRMCTHFRGDFNDTCMHLYTEV